jgi:hypothetical protein
LTKRIGPEGAAAIDGKTSAYNGSIRLAGELEPVALAGRYLI